MTGTWPRHEYLRLLLGLASFRLELPVATGTDELHANRDAMAMRMTERAARRAGHARNLVALLLPVVLLQVEGQALQLDLGLGSVRLHRCPPSARARRRRSGPSVRRAWR